MDQINLLLAMAAQRSSGSGAAILDCSELTWDDDTNAYVGDESFDGSAIYAALLAGSPVWLEVEDPDMEVFREIVASWGVEPGEQAILWLMSGNDTVMLLNFGYAEPDEIDPGIVPVTPPDNGEGENV